MNPKKSFTLLFLLVITLVSAQRYTILSGSLESLAGIPAYKVTFDYKGQNVQGFDTEEAFLNEKMDKRKNKEGEAEKFKQDWYGDREKYYELKFINYFNRRFDKGEVKISKDVEAKYTMNVKTTWIYPGYSAVAVAEPAKISAVITFFETEHPDKVLLSILFDKSIGIEQGQFDFSQGERIAGAYEKLAKSLTIQMKRFVK